MFLFWARQRLVPSVFCGRLIKFAFLYPIPSVSDQSDTTRSRSSSHRCTSCQGSACKASTSRPAYPAVVVSSTLRQAPALRHPAACSLSEVSSDLLSRRRTVGSGCCRSTAPSASGS